MVTIEFYPDSRAIAEDRAANPASADAGALEQTYFVLPVRLDVGGVELLQAPTPSDQTMWTTGASGQVARAEERAVPATWLALPLLHVATVGLEKVREAGKVGTATYELPGSGWSLRFSVTDQEASVLSTVNGRTGRAQYKELLDAFEQFASVVRTFLLREFPEMHHHPAWENWFGSSGKRASRHFD